MGTSDSFPYRVHQYLTQLPMSNAAPVVRVGVRPGPYRACTALHQCLHPRSPHLRDSLA